MHAEIWLIRVTCLCANFIGSLFNILLDLAVPTIAAEFGCSVELAIWASIGPTFVDSMLGPTMGRVADTFGYRRVWLGGMLLEVCQCLCSGLAPTIWVLLMGRPLAGMASSPARSAGFAMMCKGLAPQSRGMISSLQTTVGTLAASFGLAGSGLFIERFGWRALFLGPVLPICALWVVAYFVLPTDTGSRRAAEARQKAGEAVEPAVPFDIAGAGLLALIVACVLLFFNRGNALGWDHPALAILVGVALLATPMLLVVERRAPQPVMPFVIFQDRTRCASIAVFCASNFCWVAGSFILPLCLQRAKGLSMGNTGLLLSMRPVAGFVIAAFMSWLFSSGKPLPRRQIVQAGVTVTAVAYSLLLLVIDMDMSSSVGWGVVMTSQFLQCLGGVPTFQMCMATVVASVPADSLSTTNGVLGAMLRARNLICLCFCRVRIS